MTLYHSVKLNFVIITLVQQFPQPPSARRSASVHFKSLLVCHSAFQNLICATRPFLVTQRTSPAAPSPPPPAFTLQAVMFYFLPSLHSNYQLVHYSNFVLPWSPFMSLIWSLLIEVLAQFYFYNLFSFSLTQLPKPGDGTGFKSKFDYSH